MEIWISKHTGRWFAWRCERGATCNTYIVNQNCSCGVGSLSLNKHHIINSSRVCWHFKCVCPGNRFWKCNACLRKPGRSCWRHVANAVESNEGFCIVSEVVVIEPETVKLPPTVQLLVVCKCAATTEPEAFKFPPTVQLLVLCKLAEAIEPIVVILPLPPIVVLL